MKMPNLLLCVCLISSSVAFIGCDSTNPNWENEANLAEPIHASMQKVTDVIVYDIFSPPQASRIYAYASIAGYEAGRHLNDAFTTTSGQLNEMPEMPQPETGKEYSFSLAASTAILETGKALIFSEDQIEAYKVDMENLFRDVKMPEDVFDRSVAFGEEVSKAVLAWADSDNYKQSRTFPKFSITSDVSRWRPTPPDYMDGIEPHWLTIRPFLLDSSQQFKPLAPPIFDLKEGSKFYTDLLEVYNALDEDTENRVELASFWDCNPFVSHHRGHVMFATKKISPGGHWMGIAKTVAQSEKISAAEALETYLRVSLSLADGFISCWDEKYRSNLVRPETLINQYIDEDWQPALQTPPFPEYTSGHSVISRAAAVAMTDLFGENFAYTDSVEVDWGLAARKYDSFFEASEEAAISRLYGGIHYGPAIWEGVKQGEEVGKFVKAKLTTRNKKVSMLIEE